MKLSILLTIFAAFIVAVFTKCPKDFPDEVSPKRNCSGEDDIIAKMAGRKCESITVKGKFGDHGSCCCPKAEKGKKPKRRRMH